MKDLSPLYSLLGGGAFIGLLGALLTTRSGRQKDFDARVDKRLETLEAENDALDVENRTMALENMRLRRVLIDRGIDPDPPLPGKAP